MSGPETVSLATILDAMRPFEGVRVGWVEGCEDYEDGEPVTVKCGRSTFYSLRLGDFRRLHPLVSDLEDLADLQWRPIETAPKDGTAFLAFGVHDRDDPPGAARGVKAGDRWWAILLEDVWRGHGMVFAKDGTAPWSAPLRWMPLPAPPVLP